MVCFQYHLDKLSQLALTSPSLGNKRLETSDDFWRGEKNKKKRTSGRLNGESKPNGNVQVTPFVLLELGPNEIVHCVELSGKMNELIDQGDIWGKYLRYSVDT